MTERLAKLGMTIFIGHNAKQVSGCDVVVISSALTPDNIELQAAKVRRIPIVRRAEMLAELMRFRYGIAIAGTHGKTTTTSLCASILTEGGLDPTFVIGGKLNSAGTHASLGSGDYLVAEADESDASFLHLQPVITIVTNIDADHMETYGGDFEQLRQTFNRFLGQLPFYGLAVLCNDDPVVRSLMPQLNKPMLTYGLTPGSDITAIDIQQKGLQNHFKLSLPNQDEWIDVCLSLPGKHNVLNALAACAVAYFVGVSHVAICSALANFQGIGRRFQINADLQRGEQHLTFVDDYAHHPRELAATIQAAKDTWPDKRLIVVFQPHRYSRSRDLWPDFVALLAAVDFLLLMDIYPAGEKPLPNISGEKLLAAIQNQGQGQYFLVNDLEAIVQQLRPLLAKQTVILTAGAGSIGRLALDLPTHFA
jgi:UDP-N-acetylmuramate--alanine ligase